MTVAALFHNPKTWDEFATWSFCHAAHHRDINRVIFEQTGIRLDEFVLDPFDPNDDENWLLTHQIVHQQMDDILGISGYILSNVDWNDPAQLEMWLTRNGNEHYIAGQLLNV